MLYSTNSNRKNKKIWCPHPCLGLNVQIEKKFKSYLNIRSKKTKYISSMFHRVKAITENRFSLGMFASFFYSNVENQWPIVYLWSIWSEETPWLFRSEGQLFLILCMLGPTDFQMSLFPHVYWEKHQHTQLFNPYSHVHQKLMRNLRHKHSKVY